MHKEVTTRPLLRYPGGKYRARRLLDNIVPPNTHSVLSPFAGGASFELFLTRNGVNVECSDAYFLLINFWRQVATYPDKVADQLQNNLDVDKERFSHMQRELNRYHRIEHGYYVETQQEAIDIASMFFIVNRCSYSGATLSGGFSHEASKTRFTESAIDRVRNFYNPYMSFRCKTFYEELGDVQGVEERHDLLFLDPPYMLEKSSLYGKNGDLHKDFNHDALYEYVEAYTIPFILTYNDCPEIRSLYSDYIIREAHWSYGMNSSKKSNEIIITNYDVDLD